MRRRSIAGCQDCRVDGRSVQMDDGGQAGHRPAGTRHLRFAGVFIQPHYIPASARSPIFTDQNAFAFCLSLVIHRTAPFAHLEAHMSQSSGTLEFDVPVAVRAEKPSRLSRSTSSVPDQVGGHTGRIVFVVPPFQTTFTPSLGVSQLKANLAEQSFDAVEILYLNFQYAELIGIKQYETIVRRASTLLGDYVFSRVL